MESADVLFGPAIVVLTYWTAQMIAMRYRSPSIVPIVTCLDNDLDGS